VWVRASHQRCFSICAALLGVVACDGLELSDSDSGPEPRSDAGRDAGRDAGVEAAPDAAHDTASDAACSRGHFPTQATYPVGVQPGSVVVGDFNGDGRPDVAVANYLNDTLGVLLNAGDGTFGAQVTAPLDGYPGSVAVGDFDGDGHLDVVVATGLSHAVSVLRNLGDGTFAPELTYPAGGAPGPLAVGDFNGDEALDLAVVTQSSSGMLGVGLFLNDGKGAFAAPIPIDAGPWPTMVAAGDVNGDALIDLAVTNGSAELVAHMVDILLNEGGGMFAPPVPFAAGNASTSLVVASLRNERLDLAVTNYDDSTVSVLLNAGGGAFAAQTTYMTGAYPKCVAAGDFDGDGSDDLAVTSWNNGYVGVFLNNGSRARVRRSDNRTPTPASNVASPLYFGVAFMTLPLALLFVQ
jgi:hypothetical protein